MQKLDLGAVVLTSGTLPMALDFTESLIAQGGGHYLGFCEASLLSRALRDSALREALHAASAIFPDGVALATLARLYGYPIPQRITGPGFLLAACSYGVSRGWRHFLYGGSPGVADQLADRLRREHPSIIIAGTFSPPFRCLTAGEDLQIERLIGDAHPHLLWVCLGSPKQELWCAEHLGKIDVPVMLAVGAAFDFHSGVRPWAPAWIRQIGMEWAYRSVTGGKRIFFRNMKCVSIVGAYLLKVAVCRFLFNSGASSLRS